FGRKGEKIFSNTTSRSRCRSKKTFPQIDCCTCDLSKRSKKSLKLDRGERIDDFRERLARTTRHLHAHLGYAGDDRCFWPRECLSTGKETGLHNTRHGLRQRQPSPREYGSHGSSGQTPRRKGGSAGRVADPYGDPWCSQRRPRSGTSSYPLCNSIRHCQTRVQTGHVARCDL